MEHLRGYLPALFWAEFPPAAEVKKRLLYTLSGSLWEQEKRELFANFSRDMWIRKVVPSEIQNPCPRGQ